MEERILCPSCTSLSLRSNVHEGGSKSTQAYCPPFYDEDGRKHHHDTNVRTRSFRCSQGHSWVDTKPHTCWCGWTQGSTFPPEAPTVGRPIAVSMPDTIEASSDSEAPPAGYEVECTTDSEGFEFPSQPRKFTRLRPK